MNFIEYADRDLMMTRLAMQIAGELRDMLTHRERAALAVPGGTTPGPVFEALSEVGLPWERIDVTLTDERWVAGDHPRSNAALVRAHLLKGKAAGARFVPLFGETETPEESLGARGDAVRVLLPLSVVLLGMGEDMHTASLFPGGDKLATALSPSAPPVVAMRAEGLDEPRVTLSAPVLNGAMAKHLLITGTKKRAALARAEDLPPETAPINALMGDLTVHWAP